MPAPGKASTPLAPIGQTQGLPLPDNDPVQSISAAILTGGKSRRMGEPKAVLRLEPGGSTLIERAGSVLQDACGEVFLVGRPEWPVPEALTGLPIVEDARQGAADGLIAALEAAGHDLCLVVACDMPFLDVRFLTEMVSVARAQERSVLARDDSGRHPLHAVYRRADLPPIRELVASGERSLMRICDEIGAIAVDTGVDEARRWSVFNINTPDDLELARRHARSAKETPIDD